MIERRGAARLNRLALPRTEISNDCVDSRNPVRGDGERCTSHRRIERNRAMSTTATTLTTRPTTRAATHAHPVRRATLTSGAIAAVVTTAVAATARAADVPLKVDGEAIPLAGFPQMTLLGAVVGGILAAALNRYGAQPRRWFVAATVVLTALSCVPSVMFPPDVATGAILVAMHVIAALIIVPVLARQTRR
jgi:Family of unknown function (DUF6069)